MSAGLVPLRPPSWACRWPPSSCVLTWPSPCVCLSPHLLFLEGHLSYWVRAPHMTSCSVGHLFKDLTFKHSHVLGVRVRYMNLWGHSSAHKPTFPHARNPGVAHSSVRDPHALVFVLLALFPPQGQLRRTQPPSVLPESGGGEWRGEERAGGQHQSRSGKRQGVGAICTLKPSTAPFP